MRGGYVAQRPPDPPERLCRKCQIRPVYGENRICKYCADAKRKQHVDQRESVLAAGVGLMRGKEARGKEVKDKEKKDKEKDKEKEKPGG